MSTTLRCPPNGATTGEPYTSAADEVSSTVDHSRVPGAASSATTYGPPTLATGTNTVPPATANEPWSPSGATDADHSTAPAGCASVATACSARTTPPFEPTYTTPPDTTGVPVK